MNKVIVSSAHLYESLKKRQFVTMKGYCVRLKENLLTFDGDTLANVESKGRFSLKFKGQQITRLKNLCKLIEDQPIVVSFSDAGWIHINEAII